MSMIARFDGDCGICLGDILEGEDEVVFDSEDREWVHVECLEELEMEDGFGVA